MGLIGINQVSVQQKKSGLDKIAQGLDIANGVLGVALKVPEYLQNKKTNQLAQAASKANIAQDTVEAQPGEVGAMDVPGLGLRKAAPNLQRQIQQNTVNDTLPPSPQETNDFIATLPAGLKDKYTPEVVGRMSRGDLTAIQKSLAARDVGYDFQQKNLAKDIINSSDPYVENTQVPKGYKVKDYSAVDPTLGKRLVADKVDQRITDAHDKVNLKYEDENRKAIDKTNGLIRGGNKTLALAISRETAADNALQLLNDPSVVKNKIMTEELAMSIAAGLSGGTQPAQSLIFGLIPSTARGDINNMAQYITGHPKDFLNDSFIAQMQHTLQREKTFWGAKKDHYTRAIQFGMRPIWDRRPDLKQDYERSLQIEAADAQDNPIQPPSTDQDKNF